ncbi:MAG: FGGY family carbohydrate kinase, partial [Oscillospiraceae bacterium]|nr:FGGY family carbohydrate kinase [Oscillospiraceae bacterium]
MSSLHVLAFDLGASCGRSMLAAYDGQRMRLQEINRFPHTFSILGDQAYWDVLYLMDHIREGLRKCDAPLKSIGVDTWGVDFGLLDKNGQLLAMPRSYRDEAFSDTNMTEALEFLGGAAWLFEQTGIANINYNSVFKLYHMKKTNEVLDTAETFLMMPNLIEYFLSGVKHNEYSVVSTSQLYDMEHRDWARPVLEKLGLPLNWFTPVDRAGAALGPLSPRVARETGKEKIQVISTAGHDTACAAAAVPAKGDEYTFLSSGTWSLLGIASRKMLKGEAVAQSGISNEGAWDGGYRPTVNISGLWILQECRRQWA